MRNITLNTSTPATARITNTRHTALRFRPLTSLDIPLIRQLLPLSRSRANDFSVGGLMMWADYFDYRYCIYGNTLFIKGASEIHPELQAFSLPVGAMPLSCAIDLIRDYCRVNNIPLRFSAVPDDRIDEIRAILPGHIEQLTDWSDYIYDARALATLAGKRYNKKRNHVNRFISDNPDYSTEPLSWSNITEARNAYTRWLGTAPIDTPTSTQESLQTLQVLDNYRDYPFEGLVLRDNNRHIVAFTIGEIIGDTLFTHIEKIDHSVPGAGESINRFFAQHITSRHPGVRYINREEDAGDEGLRQAKLSYHPAILLTKYDITA